MWLIYVPWHFPLQSDNTIKGASEIAEKEFMNEYPAIYNHLLTKKEKLKNRNKSETGIRYEWYALQRYGSEYSDDFYKQKLVWTPVNSEYRFCIIPENIFINNSLFMITGNQIELLCAFLNSKLYRLYFELLLSNGNYAYGSRDFFKDVPVIKENDYKNEIISIVKRIYVDTINVKELITKIDDIIYQIYNLSDDEIKYIENSYD